MSASRERSPIRRSSTACARRFPHAAVGHAYASTEAGVAFEVDDGLAGFPASFLDACRDGVELKVVDGSLRIRSPRTASRYVGAQQPACSMATALSIPATWWNCSGDRYVFAGRKGGIINIGGLKVHPEEIEAVINRHPQVRMSLVRPKKSPGHRRDRDRRCRAAHRMRAARLPKRRSRTTYWRCAAPHCRATKCRPPSVSSRRSMSRRPANCRAAMAKAGAHSSRHRREPRPGARHRAQARGCGLSTLSRWRGRRPSR